MAGARAVRASVATKGAIERKEPALVAFTLKVVKVRRSTEPMGSFFLFKVLKHCVCLSRFLCFHHSEGFLFIMDVDKIGRFFLILSYCQVFDGS